LPVNVTVLSDGEALYSDRHELAWSVQSLSPLISHQLQLQDLSDSVSYCIFHCSLAVRVCGAACQVKHSFGFSDINSAIFCAGGLTVMGISCLF